MRFVNWLLTNGLNGIVVGLIGLILVYNYFSSTLPAIQDYNSPPILSRVYDNNGELIGQYAAEKRLFTPYELMPKHLIEAFVAAEDQNFFVHPGIDMQGFARAFRNNILELVSGSGGRLEGASTITQQLVKNLYLDNSRSLTRKFKEILISLKLERTYTKEHILELYLNWIYLGEGAHGVGQASLTYFNKPVHEIGLAEAAYLAAVPKGPARYHPVRHAERAKARRDWVIGRMVDDGYITEEAAQIARETPLSTMDSKPVAPTARTYFSEEVRRKLIAMFGKDKVYGEGLSVSTSLDSQLQGYAHKVLLDGTFEFSKNYGWDGAITSVDPVGDWGMRLLETKGYLTDLPGWQVAIVLDVNRDKATIGIKPDNKNDALTKPPVKGVLTFNEVKWAKNQDGKAPKTVSDVLQIGDVIYVEKIDSQKNFYALRKLPEVQGAIVVMSPETGRVYALVGGNSFQLSEFNRATQALRQPGSSFKPLTFGAAIEQGYTPATVLLDAPIEIDQKNEDGIWRPTNYAGSHLGPTTLWRCLERSCNLLTVRLAQSVGMGTIVTYAKALGAYTKLPPLLSVTLGSYETTVISMASAFSAFANGGYSVKPTLIDRVQDRQGKVLLKQDSKDCQGCSQLTSATSLPPRLTDKRWRVFSPLTAYQVNKMMQGVVQNGTGHSAKVLGENIGGKTGTSNDEKDAWFIGFSSDLVVAVWIGFDTPKPMGKHGTGGSVAAPIFTDFMKKALKRFPARPFPSPFAGDIIRFNKVTGNRALTSQEGVNGLFRPGNRPGENLWIYNEQNRDGVVYEDTNFDGLFYGTSGGLY